MTELKKVTRHTRAPRGGRGIICPNCGDMTRAWNFAWKSLVCDHCKQEIEKPRWLIKPKPKTKPTACFLCGRNTIYPSQLDHPYHRENLSVCYNCGFDQDDIKALRITEPIELRCPWIVPGTGRRCDENRIVTAGDLAGLLGFRCPGCQTYTGGLDLIINNIPAFRDRYYLRTKGK